jgi:hypothetical protein
LGWLQLTAFGVVVGGGAGKEGIVSP